MKRYTGLLLAFLLLVLTVTGCESVAEPHSSAAPPIAESDAVTETTTTVATTSTTTATTTGITNAVTTTTSTTATDVATTVATTTTTTPTLPPDLDPHWETDKARQVLELLNESRVAAGLQPLQMDNNNMLLAAQTRVKEITVSFDHKRLNGDIVFSVFTEFGVSYTVAGENLAMGYPTAEEVYQGWWESPGHHANLMNERFTHISIAVMKYDGFYYWVQLFRG